MWGAAPVFNRKSAEITVFWDGITNNYHLNLQTLPFFMKLGTALFIHCFLPVILCITGFAAPSSLVINEFMSSNNETIADEDGDFEDWIEILNTGNEPLRLKGYGLTDSQGDFFRWVFPDTTLGSGARLLIWASGKNRRIPGRPLHTSFSIAAEGEPVRLSDINGTRLDTVPPVQLPTDYSYGRQLDGSDNWVFFGQSTPGFPNTTDGVARLLYPPDFSHQGGFYAHAFDLTLALPDHQADAHIYYTTDGSNPGPDNGQRLLEGQTIRIDNRTSEPNDLSMIRTNNIGEDDPLNDGWKPPLGQVFKGTVVRAAAWAPDSESVRVATRTFWVGEDLYDRYRIPVVSLATDRDHFFSPDTGIYVPENYWGRGEEFERPIHFEFFETGGMPVLAQDAGVRIHGGTSRARPVKSLRVYARRSYGETWFEHPLLPDAPVERYKRFLLRNSGNDWDRAYFRDALMQKLVEHTSVETQYYRPVVVFLNGEYWGIHNIRKRYDHRYFETMYDLDRDDLVLLEGDAERKEGTREDRRSYLQFRDFVDQEPDMNHPQIWQRVRDRVDLENFMDYHIANIYFRNTDWPGNNIDFWRKRTDGPQDGAPPGHDGRWRWLLFDTDFGFNLDYLYVPGHDSREQHNTLSFAVHGDNVSWPNPDWSVQMLRGLLRNGGFRRDFINRFADLLNTAFTPERVEQEIETMYDALKPHIGEHVVRWRGPETMQEWEDEVESMRDFARRRPDAQREHIRSHFGLPGLLNLSLDVNDPVAGYLRIHSVDVKPGEIGIPDQPWPWSGIYFKDVPFTVTAVPAEGYLFTGWDGRPQSGESLTIRTFQDELTLKANFEAVNVSADASGSEEGLPETFRLEPARPNPFNSSAVITVALPESGRLRVIVYSVDGRRVATLLDDEKPGGFHELPVDASRWASGVYVITAETSSGRASIPVTLVK